jgi:septal ring factor EnvC (AmiA/AmiB activator)
VIENASVRPREEGLEAPEDTLFALRQTRAHAARLEAELRRIEHQMAQVEADRAALQSRLDERDSYVAAIHRSGGWKLLQKIRDLVGRRW